MSSRSSQISLDDILQAIEKIERFISGLNVETFQNNDLISDAVLRNLEIIGEASAQIPRSLRRLYSHIPWKRMVGLRNIIIHAYHNVDLTIIWQIITVNLPEVKPDLIKMRDDLSSYEEKS